VSRVQKTFRRNPGELQEALIHRAGIDIVPLHPGMHGTAFIDHASEMHVTREAFPNASRVSGS
jgi:hypothetical protein